MSPSALILGKSEAVLADTVAILQTKGYAAQATNLFDDAATYFDLGHYDVVVFGGQVPPSTRERLSAEIRQLNPKAALVNGLSGIAGLIAAQVEGAAAGQAAASDAAPGFDPVGRRITLSLNRSRTVTVTAWWPALVVPPDPKSDSLVLIDGQRIDGELAIALPDVVPQTAFVTVRLDDMVHAFRVETAA
jgi:hypothetical protein